MWPSRWSRPTATRPGYALIKRFAASGSLIGERAQHDAAHAGLERRVVDLAAACLHRHVTAAAIALIDLGVHGPVTLGRVEVDDVDPRRALRCEVLGDRDRVVAVVGLAVEVAFGEAHDAAAAQIDGGIQIH